MSELKDRILKGCDYWETLVPSKMMVTGMVNPRQWIFLQEFVKLVRAYCSGTLLPEKENKFGATVEDMNLDEVKKIFE